MKRTPRFAGAIVLAVLALYPGCSKDSTGTNTGGSITLALSGGTLSIAQGANGTLTATITRSGSFTGPVNITVEGLPANVTAAANPASIAAGSTTGTITFTAAAAAAVANTTVTVRAAGSGVTDKTATFTLTITAAAGGSFTVALSPTALTIQQGNQNTSTATLTRTGGFAGNVTFSATGNPAGMTVSFNPTATTANTTTVTVAVGAAVAANTYQVVIHGVSGSIDQTATLSVTVTTSGGGGGSTTFKVCGQAPALAAFQDFGGNWTVATVANGAWTFNLPSGRGGVAYVIANTNSYVININYGTQAELNNGALPCRTVASGTKSVSGTVANVSQTEIANVSMGSGSAFVLPIVSNNFTLTNLADGNLDLLATRGTQSTAGIVANKFIARRSFNPAANSVLPVLDFNAAEAQNLVQRNVTVNGLTGGETAVLFETFSTALGTTTTLYTEAGGTATATRPVPAVGTTQSGDLHLLQLFAGSGSFPYAQYRGILAYMQNSNAQTFTLGPVLNAVTVSTASTSPVRLRAVHTIQPEYSSAVNVQYQQSVGTTSRAVVMTFSAGYLNNSTAFDQSMPDLTTLTGWQSIWNLVTGTAVQWTFNGAKFTGSPVIQDGLTLTVGVRTGAITP